MTSGGALFALLVIHGIYGRHIVIEEHLKDTTKGTTQPRENGKITYIDVDYDFETDSKVTVTDRMDRTATENPPMVCWEMACPECAVGEPDGRCFLRGFLTAAIRGGLLVVAVGCLVALVLICNHKKETKLTTYFYKEVAKKPLL